MATAEDVSTAKLTGGCHCGHIRYEISGMPFDADYCHCRDCHKITGAPVSAWVDVKVAQLSWLGATPKEYASSETIRRGFCPECGSTLSYRSTAYQDYFTLSIGSLDDPGTIAPKYHIYTQDMPSWLVIEDDNPRYATARGNTK
ncbi:GFA family protein [Shewanella sp.]|uniref:GFA family protein n=1 Tax=Shewanella sp. TaxID=50422 RepID=UPI003565C3D2